MKGGLSSITRITIAVILGIASCKILILSIDIEVWELLVASVFFLAYMFLLNRKTTPLAFGLATFLFSATFGALIFLSQFHSIRDGADIRTNSLVSGMVIKKPERKAKTWATRISTSEGTQILAYLSEECPPSVGDSVELSCPYGMTPTYMGDNPDSAYADYRNYLFYSGISATVFSGKGQWKITKHNEHKNLINRLASLQDLMNDYYDESGFIGDEGAIIRVMTTGDKSKLGKGLRKDYSHAGVAHVLALSGFHLTIIYSILDLLFLSFVISYKWRNIARLFIILIIFAFTIIVGCPASLVRASVMCGIMMLTKILQQENSSLNSLSLTALIMLVCNPMLLFDVGFQLSFVSMLGIIVFSPILTGIMPTRQKILHKLWEMASITVACSIFTLPLITYYFGYIPLLSIVSNLSIPILATALLWLSAIWWLSFAFTDIQSIIGNCMKWISGVMNSIAGWISSMEWSVILIHSNLFGVLMEYVLLLLLVIYLPRLLHFPSAYRTNHQIL